MRAESRAFTQRRERVIPLALIGACLMLLGPACQPAEHRAQNDRGVTLPVHQGSVRAQRFPTLSDVFGSVDIQIGTWLLSIHHDGGGSITMGASPLYGTSFPSGTYDMDHLIATVLYMPIAHEEAERRGAVHLTFRRGEGRVQFFISDTRAIEPLVEQLANRLDEHRELSGIWRQYWPVPGARDPQPVPPVLPGGYSVGYGGPENVLLMREPREGRATDYPIGFTITQLGVSGRIIYGKHKAPETGVRTGFIVDARTHELTRDIPLMQFEGALKDRGVATPNLFDSKRFQGRPYGGDGTWQGDNERQPALE